MYTNMNMNTSIIKNSNLMIKTLRELYEKLGGKVKNKTRQNEQNTQ